MKTFQKRTKPKLNDKRGDIKKERKKKEKVKTKKKFYPRTG